MYSVRKHVIPYDEIDLQRYARGEFITGRLLRGGFRYRSRAERELILRRASQRKSATDFHTEERISRQRFVTNGIAPVDERDLTPGV